MARRLRAASAPVVANHRDAASRPFAVSARSVGWQSILSTSRSSVSRTLRPSEESSGSSRTSRRARSRAVASGHRLSRRSRAETDFAPSVLRALRDDGVGDRLQACRITERVRDEHAWWLDDYALFRALHARHEERPWTEWPSRCALVNRGRLKPSGWHCAMKSCFAPISSGSPANSGRPRVSR